VRANARAEGLAIADEDINVAAPDLGIAPPKPVPQVAMARRPLFVPPDLPGRARPWGRQIRGLPDHVPPAPVPFR